MTYRARRARHLWWIIPLAFLALAVLRFLYGNGVLR